MANAATAEPICAECATSAGRIPLLVHLCWWCCSLGRHGAADWLGRPVMDEMEGSDGMPWGITVGIETRGVAAGEWEAAALSASRLCPARPRYNAV